MKSHEHILDSFDDLLTDLAAALEERIEDSVEEKGVLKTCPHCVALEMVEECSTALLQDLYKVGKDDPQLLLSALTKTLMNTAALQILLQKMLEHSFHLFEDDLPDKND